MTWSFTYFGKICQHAYVFMSSSGSKMFLFLRTGSPGICTLLFPAIYSCLCYQNNLENNQIKRQNLVWGRLKATFSDFGVYFTDVVWVSSNRFGSIFLFLPGNSLKLLQQHLQLWLLSSMLVFCQLSRASSHVSLLHNALSFLLRLISFLLVDTISGTRVNARGYVSDVFLQWKIQSILNILGAPSIAWHTVW